MTGIRQSIVFSKEDTYGKGKGDNYVWLAPPPGTFFQSQHNRDVKRIQTTGSKFWDSQAYGQLSGSWSWTFTFDYEYLEPFYFVFESITADTSANTVSFTKANNMRVPSFTIRRKINNQMVGGSLNEITELTGCVVKEVSFQRNASTSKIDVSLSGFYANEALVADPKNNSVWSTDYQEYSSTGGLVEYSCLFITDDSSPPVWDYMANTESITIRMENSADRIYSICSPFASNYYEGLTNISLTTTCYSTNPKQYKTRLYSGGYTNDPTKYGGAYVPLSKGMKPVPGMSLLCYTGTIRSDDPDYGGGDTAVPDIKTTFDNSQYYVDFELSQVVIKSLPWQKGDGGKLQDTISGSEVRTLTMIVKTSSTMSTLSNWFVSASPHDVTSNPTGKIFNNTNQSGQRGDTA